MTRALTGLIYVALIVAGVMVSNVTMMLLCYLLAALGVSEFVRITGHASMTSALIDVVGALLLVSAGAGGAATEVLFGIFLVYVLVKLVAMVYSRRRDALLSTAFSFMAMIYIALPMALLYGMRAAGDAGRWVVLAMFIMIWLNDTGAYLVGSAIGRHRLLERVSPKKSVEGFVGGVVFAVAAAPIFYFCFPAQFGAIPLWTLFGVGLCAGVVGTLGDLAESRIKRTLGVKDSGNILPGHGGILDRIDSLLLVTPAVAVVLLF